MLQRLISGKPDEKFVDGPGRCPALSGPAQPIYDSCQALVIILNYGVYAGTDTKIINGTFKSFDTYTAVLGAEAVGWVVAKSKDTARPPQIRCH